MKNDGLKPNTCSEEEKVEDEKGNDKLRSRFNPYVNIVVCCLPDLC